MEVFMKAKRNLIKKIPGAATVIRGSLALLVTACLGSDLIRESGYSSGVFEGVGRGSRGQIIVQVQTSPAGIEDIVIISHRETQYPGTAAMEELLDLVLETGSADLDVISGASYSSRGFLEAVESALTKAREYPVQTR